VRIDPKARPSAPSTGVGKGRSGIPKLLLIIGGFAVLIVSITVYSQLGDQASEPPPPQPAPVAPSPPAEPEQHPREASPSPPAPVAPSALPAAPESPPKKQFADECTDTLFKVANPSLPAYSAEGADRSGVGQFIQNRLAHARKACDCIEAVYRRHGINDLSGEDARRGYDEVLKRHGREPPGGYTHEFSHCERHAR
jgi:hypothetical protein